jgi:AcrR family transcriptional regulator
MTTDLEIRERILEHSRDEFLTRGFSKVTIDEIATNLGISKKTLYKFYPSKEELLRASLHAMMRSAGWELERIASSNRPLVEKLASALMLVGKYVSRLRSETISDFQRFVPSLWKELDEFRQEQIINRLVRMLQQGRAENVFRPEVNEQVLIYMLVSSLRTVIHPLILSKHSFSAEEAAKSIFKVLFEGAFTDEARKEFHVLENSTELL